MIQIQLAKENDLEDIRQMYRAAIGSEGCTWSEQYPNDEIMADDMRRKALFCARNEKDEIVAAVSIDADEKVDGLENWSNSSKQKNQKEAAEVARLVVKEEYQSQGIAVEMLRFMMKETKRRGYHYLHFLVSQKNEKALRSYAKLDFENRGETYLYGEHWWCYEKNVTVQSQPRKHSVFPR